MLPTYYSLKPSIAIILPALFLPTCVERGHILIGLATCNAWARTKHFGCPSVISSVCYPGIPL